jgi:hypothetical protein
MRHAISINSCPFCGRTIFSASEYEFRKSVQRILIKNGLEDEDMMMGIVDDITTVLGEQFTRDKSRPEVGDTELSEPVTRKILPGTQGARDKTTRKAPPRIASQAEIEEAMASEDGDDANVVRTLAPDPARTSRQPRQLTKADQMAINMQEWQRAQNIDDDSEYDSNYDDNITHAQDGADEDDTDASVDLEKLARMQKEASAERVRQVQANSGFKNTPIQRKPR